TDGDGSHGSTSKTPSYTKSVSWHHYRGWLYKNYRTQKRYYCPRRRKY
ncbi:transposase, partial [Escherichia coli]